MMHYTRQYVEMKGQMSAGVVSETDEWQECTILGDIPIYVRKDDESVTPALVKDGFWEAWITSWLLNELTSEHKWFLDIGAHTGYHSLIAKSKGATVMAFEPNPKYAKMLRSSTKIGWDQTRGDWLPPRHFSVYEWAVANEVGKAHLTIPQALQGSASICGRIDEDVHPSDTIEVNTVTVDRILAGIERKDMIIKVDAEGAEELVWDGASTTRYRHKPVWMLEYTPGAYSPLFLDKLEEYGDLKWINHDGVEEIITRESILSQSDWIMLVVRPRG